MSPRTQKTIYFILGLIVVLGFLYILINYLIIPLWVNKAVPQDQKQNPPTLKLDAPSLANSIKKSGLDKTSTSQNETITNINLPEVTKESPQEVKSIPQEPVITDDPSQYIFSRGNPNEQLPAYRV